MTRNYDQLRQALSWVGWLLLIVWCLWWLGNLIIGRMLFVEGAWFQPPAFGVDFMNGVYNPTRTWMDDGDPYQLQRAKFNYAPIVTRLFMWVTLTDFQTSLRIWVCVTAVFAALGAAAAVRSRAGLDLERYPTILGVALILFSTPVVFALERGNCDLLIVPCIVGALILMRKPDPTRDVVAGGLVAVAAWVKIYPALLIVALFAIRRQRVAMWMAVWCILIGLADLPELLRFIRNISIDIASAKALAVFPHEIRPWNHTLAVEWRDLWAGTPLSYLPGQPATVLTIGSLFGWVSWQVYRTPTPLRITLPYLYWSVAAATFIPVISNDYNLTPLLLAVLALWTRQYSWRIHAGLIALALWWQPFALPLSGRVVYFIKLLGLITVAAMLTNQARRHGFLPRISIKNCPEQEQAGIGDCQHFAVPRLTNQVTR